MFLSHFIHWILYFNIAAYRCIESIWFFYSNIFLRLSHLNTYFKTLLFGSGEKWIWWIALSFHLVSIIFQSYLLLPLIPSTPVVVVWVPQVVPVRHRALPYSARYHSLLQSYHSALWEWTTSGNQGHEWSSHYILEDIHLWRKTLFGPPIIRLFTCYHFTIGTGKQACGTINKIQR